MSDETRQTGDVVERAEALFREGYACSQAVLLAFAPRFGIDRDVAAGLSSAFGGGMARHGWTCGAITGALMVIGLHAGNRTAQEPERKEDAYSRVQTLVARFLEEHGSTLCRSLIGYELSEPSQREAASNAGVFVAKCPRFVRTAAALASEDLASPAI